MQCEVIVCFVEISYICFTMRKEYHTPQIETCNQLYSDDILVVSPDNGGIEDVSYEDWTV